MMVLLTSLQKDIDIDIRSEVIGVDIHALTVSLISNLKMKWLTSCK